MSDRNLHKFSGAHHCLIVAWLSPFQAVKERIRQIEHRDGAPLWRVGSDISRFRDHLDAEKLGFEIRIDHKFVLTVCDFHHIVEMCYCHIDRMAAMGICFDHVGVMSIGKFCHIVGVGVGMMVVHILEFVVHVVF
ncbi:hypothetical protein Tco_1113815, partial [Tanacetum coccineum]